MLTQWAVSFGMAARTPQSFKPWAQGLKLCGVRAAIPKETAHWVNIFGGDSELKFGRERCVSIGHGVSAADGLRGATLRHANSGSVVAGKARAGQMAVVA